MDLHWTAPAASCRSCIYTECRRRENSEDQINVAVPINRFVMIFPKNIPTNITEPLFFLMGQDLMGQDFVTLTIY